MFYVKFI